MNELGVQPGTYAVLLHLQQDTLFPVVGRVFRNIYLPAGYYGYLGSAFGSGGVRGRVGHHLRHADNPRWNLDFVRPAMDVYEVWFTHDPLKRECAWAGLFHAALGRGVPVPGFGSWDCDRCAAHFFHYDRPPSWLMFRRAIKQKFPGHDQVARLGLAEPALTRVTEVIEPKIIRPRSMAGTSPRPRRPSHARSRP